MEKLLRTLNIRTEVQHVLPSPCHSCGKNIETHEHASFINNNLYCPKCHNHKLFDYITDANKKKTIVYKNEIIAFAGLVLGLLWLAFFSIMELINPFYFDNFIQVGFTIMAIPHLRVLLRVIFKGPRSEGMYSDRTIDMSTNNYSRPTYFSNFNIFQSLFLLALNFFIGITYMYLAPFRYMYDISIRVYNRIKGKKIWQSYRQYFTKYSNKDRFDTKFNLSLTGEFESYKESSLEYFIKRTKTFDKYMDLSNQSKVLIAKNVDIKEAFDQLIDFNIWFDQRKEYFPTTYYLDKVI